jgi:hypothetical protein
MVTLSPAFPSSGLIVSIFGATPKQAVTFPAVSAVLNLGFSAFGFVAFGSWLGFGFLAFDCGSAAGAIPKFPQRNPTATMLTIMPIYQLKRIAIPVSLVGRLLQADN